MPARESKNRFDLAPDQRQTASLLERLLGKAVAYRYVDFCRLAAGAFELRVSQPLAAHALRELDSLLRLSLQVPLEAKTDIPPDEEKESDARRALAEIGFDEDAIQRAVPEA